MSTVTLKGSIIHTTQTPLPDTGTKAPDFSLTQIDLSEISLADLKNKKILLNIFPSLDTPTCAMSVRRFNQDAATMKNTVVLCVSMDLPFAAARFCAAEGIKNVQAVSAFRSPAFGEQYGVLITDGPLRGLLARAVVIIDEKGLIRYSQLVPEITMEPDYESALNALR